jgi:hypothetical protein
MLACFICVYKYWFYFWLLAWLCCRRVPLRFCYSRHIPAIVLKCVLISWSHSRVWNISTVPCLLIVGNADVSLNQLLPYHIWAYKLLYQTAWYHVPYNFYNLPSHFHMSLKTYIKTLTIRFVCIELLLGVHCSGRLVYNWCIDLIWQPLSLWHYHWQLCCVHMYGIVPCSWNPNEQSKCKNFPSAL